MLARTSSVTHKASGVVLQTPILVPSFSSKGFRADPENPDTSEIAEIFQVSAEFLTDSFLLSAYDLHYRFLPEPWQFPCTPELVFLDSGGYEVSPNDDLSAVYRPEHAPQIWSRELLESELSKWPGDLPAVFISYDHPEERLPYLEQVAAARDLFRRHPGHLEMFLLKPEATTQRTLQNALRSARADPEKLASFDAIGVTEKELGGSALERMLEIARLRRAMDDAGVRRPLHIFGALDPVSTALYFLSGAEIFDGLTWIRFSYSNHRCVYTQNVGALDYGIHFRDNGVRSRSLANNLYYLAGLGHALRDFEATGDFAKLPHCDFMRNAWDTLQGRLQRGGH